MRRYAKLVGALLGGMTGAGVAALLALAGVEVTPAEATALAVMLSSIGTFLAPKNAGSLPHMSSVELFELAAKAERREQA